MQLREHNKTHLAEYKSHSVFVDKRSFCLNIDYVVVVVVVCVCVLGGGGGGGEPNLAMPGFWEYLVPHFLPYWS